MIQRCESCGSNDTLDKKISLDYMGKKIQRVPAIVCQDCGEEMVMSDVLERVEDIIKSGKSIYYDGPVIKIKYALI